MKIKEYKKYSKWELLLKVQLDSDLKSIKFEQQYKFHPTRRWKFDFAAPNIKLAIEVDGAEFSFGRHSRGLGMAADNEKINTAIILGWKVFKFTGTQVKTGYAIDFLVKNLHLVL